MDYMNFYNKLDLMNNKEYIEKFLIYNSSLVIAGIKPGVTVTIKKNKKKLYSSWLQFGSCFMETINLSFVELRESNDSIIIMIYDKIILEDELNKDSHIEFLRNIGYSFNYDVNYYIDTLKSRYKNYHCPHELGLFLGIPFDDVKDFMECTTKKCLLCGYWKVYNDSDKAKKIFNNYDKVKEYTIKNILKGNSSRELALSIRDSFYRSIQYI
jgi:hypothetical protein